MHYVKRMLNEYVIPCIVLSILMLGVVWVANSSYDKEIAFDDWVINQTRGGK